MKTVISAVSSIFYFICVTLIWQFPQTIGGFFLLMFLYITRQVTREEKFKNKRVIRVVHTCPIGAVSFGEIIILRERWEMLSPQVKNHEYGHSIQSVIIGPLYLIVIGIPSLLLNSFQAFKFKKVEKELLKKHGSKTWQYYTELETRRTYYLTEYYKFYTEAWADFIGGVVR